MPLLRMYAITTIVLGLKMFANTIVQVSGRLATQAFTNPEDVEVFGGKLETQETSAVRRVAAVWRNDLENIPFFLIMAGIYVMATGLSSEAFEIYCLVFVVARVLHSFFYLKAMQPWRTIAYSVGSFATFAMMIHLLFGVVLA